MTELQFEAQVQAALDRVAAIRKRANATDGPLIQAVLTEALEEMGLAFEELRVAQEELRVQNEALAEAEARAVAERDKYRDLFEFAPNGYLVTDAEGTVRELNKAACELLQITPRYAPGKPLSLFVRKEDRAEFL